MYYSVFDKSGQLIFRVRTDKVGENNGSAVSLSQHFRHRIIIYIPNTGLYYAITARQFHRLCNSDISFSCVLCHIRGVL